MGDYIGVRVGEGQMRPRAALARRGKSVPAVPRRVRLRHNGTQQPQIQQHPCLKHLLIQAIASCRLPAPNV